MGEVKLPHVPQRAEVLVLTLAANDLPRVAVGRIGNTAIFFDNGVLKLGWSRNTT